jgi:peroxiredoxin
MAAVAQVEVETRFGVFPPGLTHVAYASYRATSSATKLPRERRAQDASEALRVLASAHGVALRGTYDTSGYRGDAHLLVWLAAAAPDLLQDGLAAFGRTAVGSTLEPFWTAIGVHSPSERTGTTAPAYYRGEGARRYLCVHPLAYSVDWYLLEPHLRRRMISDDHRLAREHPEVRTNTVSAFGMGDHEWLLAYESDQLVKIVELQRHLRSAALRRYVQADLPMITGVRKPLAQILEALP